jgi:hypothetical protein
MTPRFVGHRERRDIRSELQWADVVATIGRGVLEAAACARPVVILGALGFDGLLTPETAGEAFATNYNGFARRATPTVDELASHLTRATSDLGIWSRRWVEEHHDAKKLVPLLVSRYEGAMESARARLKSLGAEELLRRRHREYYPAIRWWQRLPDQFEWQLRAEQSTDDAAPGDDANGLLSIWWEQRLRRLRREHDRITVELSQEVQRLHEEVSRRQELIESIYQTKTWTLRTVLRRLVGRTT